MNVLKTISIFCLTSKKIVSIFLFFWCSVVFAQTKNMYPTKQEAETIKSKYKTANCGFDYFMENNRKTAAYLAKEANFNKRILNAGLSESNDTVTLPVVVHIISYFPNLISDATVINAVKDLNDAFANMGIYASPTGTNTRIKFCLAHIDPDSGTTSGITRTTSFFSTYMNGHIEDARLKNLIQWPPESYVNIWYIQSMEVFISSQFMCGGWNISKAGGYATLPPAGGLIDGIVVTKFGTMLAHEMGHYLGLYHTFQGGCKNIDCTTDGDMVCDTPPDGSTASSPACNNPDNSCHTDSLSGFLHDTTDYISNFMDYGNQPCRNSFTPGQATRMLLSLFTFRSGLLALKCDYRCNTNAVAYFNQSINYPIAGDLVNFSNASTNATVYKWYLNDVLVSTNSNYGNIFSTQGKYKLALHAFESATDTCYSSYIAYVIVNCGVTARFYPSANVIASLLPNFPDTVKFTNTSYGANQFEWYYLKDASTTPVLMGTSANLDYVFPSPGNYYVYLIASNGTCVDKTSMQAIEVIDPTPDGICIAINVLCYRDSGLSFELSVCNNGFATIKKNVPISFYEFNPNLPNANLLGTYYTNKEVNGFCCEKFPAQIMWYNHTGYKTLYVVYNDSGHTTTPFQFKNTFLVESSYNNNISFASNRYKVTATPNPITTAVPFDVVTITANTNEPTNSTKWSPAFNLSCTNCTATDLTIDSNRMKQVIALSNFGCRDTDYVNIIVPPHNDLIAKIINAECYFKDSININFKIRNYFKKGKILKNTTVAFYSSNPYLPGARLMPPIFSVPQFVNDTVKRYNIKIKNLPTTAIWTVISDTNLGTPISLPSTWYIETNYQNNVDSFAYENNPRNIIDSTICEGKQVYGYNKTGTYVDTYTAHTGCDSFRIIHLTVTPRSIEHLYKTICIGDTFIGYYNSGTYYDTLVASSSCDSVRILHLFVATPTYSTHIRTICEGDTLWGHSTVGVFTDTLVNINSCDSFRTLNLFLKPKSYFNIYDTICAGDTLNGHTTTGIYKDILVAANGCDSVVTLYLQVNPVPKPKLGRDRELCYTDSTSLFGGNFDGYRWSNGSNQPSIIIDRGGAYWLTVTNQYSCSATDSIIIKPVLCHNIFVPNIFSPNNDGRNDTWVIKDLAYFNNTRVTVYNRNGQVVFSSPNYNSRWDGTYMNTRQKLPVATYYYVIDLFDVKQTIGGSVTILY